MRKGEKDSVRGGGDEGEKDSRRGEMMERKTQEGER